jgi:arylsulfatase A-like enzyme
MRGGRAAHLLLAALLPALLGGGCDRGPAPPLLRLASLHRLPPATVPLPAGGALGAAPLDLAVDLDALRLDRLELEIEGGDGLATLSWRLRGERQFPRHRGISFQLAGDGGRHRYALELDREQQWLGRVTALRLSAAGTPARLIGGRAVGRSSLARPVSLGGMTLSSLPGQPSLTLTLPAGSPRRARLETWLGLLPQFDRPGVVAHFRAVAMDGDEEEVWLDEEIRGGATGERWREVSADVAPPAGGTLRLEVRVERQGRALPHSAAVWGSPVLVPARAARRTNLLLVVVDTLRADALGAYGNERAKTPRLDRLAGEGIRFAELHAPSPWTLPSVASLLTGLQPATHGAGERFGDYAPQGLADGFETLAERLAAQGFATGAVYQNIYLNPEFGIHQGFDVYASFEDPEDAARAARERSGDARVLVDRALARLEAWRDRPFFLYLHLFDPHNPYIPPADLCAAVATPLAADTTRRGCVADRRPEKPMPGEDERAWMRALYAAEVAYTDRELGRLLDGLERLQLADDTVVALVSDHGEEFWERAVEEAHRGYEVNADHGHTLYEELLRVPGLLRIPGQEPMTVAEPVEMVDLLPTLLAALGVGPPTDVQGRDLLPRLAGQRAPQLQPLLAGSILHGPPRWSLRRGPWKLVLPDRGDAAAELYHLGDDPGELRDLAAARPAEVAALRALLARERGADQALRARLLEDPAALRATYLEWSHITKLRSLGYLR